MVDEPARAFFDQVLRDEGDACDRYGCLVAQDHQLRCDDGAIWVTVYSVDNGVQAAMRAHGSFGLPDRAHRLAQTLPAPVLPLVAVEYGILGEEGDVGIGVAPGRGIVRSSHHVENVQSIGVGEHQALVFCAGRSQPSIRLRNIWGNMCLGTIPWTVFGGIEV